MNKLKKILNLYTLDWRRILRNPVAILLMLALIILPSLYAWFNIAALWDPYGNTSDLKVAVYSEDQTKEIVPPDLTIKEVNLKVTKNSKEKINIGNEIITNLKKNKLLNWQFVKNKNELDEGVKSGKYYAGIYIPKTFSQNLIGFINGDIIKPQIVYKVNEKINAISPKITDKGATAIQEEIITNFTKKVSDTLIKKANDMGVDLKNSLPKINKASSLILYMDSHWKVVDQYRHKLKDIQGRFPQIKKDVNQANKVVSKFDEINKTLNKVTELNSKLPELEKYGKYAEKLQKELPKIEELGNYLDDFDTGDTDLEDLLNNVTNKTDTLLATLNNIIDNLGDDDISQELKIILTDASTKIDNINKVVKKYTAKLPEIRKAIHLANTELKAHLGEIKGAINQAVGFYKNDYPKVKKELNRAAKFIKNDLPGIEKKIKTTLNEVNTKLPEIEKSITNLNKLIDKNYSSTKKEIDKVATIIKENKKSGTLSNLMKILSVDASTQSDYISKPVDQKKEELYKIPNYGSASAPFYTALCLWVGALLVVSLIEPKMFVKKEDKDKYTRREKHVAKLSVLLTIAILQSIIVSVGNIYILHTYNANPVGLILSSIFIGLIFMGIVYTLVALFGNVGKGIGIIILVLSISGGGGNFPIELSGGFFKAINPYLPFKYAVDLLREMVGGIYLSTMLNCLLILFLFGLITIILGVIFEPKGSKISGYMHKKVEEAHFFH